MCEEEAFIREQLIKIDLKKIGHIVRFNLIHKFLIFTQLKI